MKTFKKLKKGFTLVELVVVIAVIAILAAVSVGAYFGVTESANNSKLEQEAKQVYTAIQTVALAPNEIASLDKEGLKIEEANISTFETELEKNLGTDITVTTGTVSTVTGVVVNLSTSAYSVSPAVGTPVVYKTFEYYNSEVGGKKAVADVVTGDCKVVASTAENIPTQDPSESEPIETPVVEPDVETKTIEQLKAMSAHNDKAYNIEAFIIGYKDSSSNATAYGNFWLADSISYTKDQGLLVYGATEVAEALTYTSTSGYTFVNPNSNDVDNKTPFPFADYDIGDKVQMKVFVTEYNDTLQINGIILNHDNSPIDIKIGGDFNSWGSISLTNTKADHYEITLENIEEGCNFKVGTNAVYNSDYNWNGGNISINGTINGGDNAVFTEAGTRKVEVNFLTKTCVATLLASASENIINLNIADLITYNPELTYTTAYTSYENVKLNEEGKIRLNATGARLWEGDKTLRLYQNQNATLSLSCSDDISIKSITFTFKIDNTGTLLYNSTVINSASEFETEGNLISFTVGNSGTKTNGQIQISNITIKY